MKRYVLHAEKEIIEEHFEVHSDSDSLYPENFNVMPGNSMPVIISGKNGRKILSSRWGLRSEKGSEEEIASIPQDDIHENEKYKKLVQESPCIIPVSGFYKWKDTVKDPLPFYIRFLSNEVIGLAGISHTWKSGDGRNLHTYSVLTMPANALVEPLDDNMPCVLESSQYETWLEGKGMKILERGFTGDGFLPDMAVYRVPELVNDPSNNARELIQPIPKLRNYDMEDED